MRRADPTLGLFYRAAANLFEGRDVPDWIRNHPAIKDKPAPTKVFPKYGLPNFKEPADIPAAARVIDTDAQFVVDALWGIRNVLRSKIGNGIHVETEQAIFRAKRIRARELVDRHKAAPENSQEQRDLEKELIGIQMNRKSPEELAAEEKALNASRRMYEQIGYLADELYVGKGAATNVANGTVVLIAPVELTMAGKKIGLAGESLPRVYGKIITFAAAYLNSIGASPDAIAKYLPSYDSIPEVKAFSRNNMPLAKDLYVVFSASGDEGAWDIATMSMRGVSSCQTWDGDAVSDEETAGARRRDCYNQKLVGSIVSSNVGVIYLTSGKDFNGMGEKIIRRSIVRFAIDTDIPADKENGVVVIDRMFDSWNPLIAKAFVNAIQKRTKLRVIDLTDKDGSKEALESLMLPVEESPVSEKSRSYQDSKIPDYSEKEMRSRKAKAVESAISRAYNTAYDLYPGTGTERNPGITELETLLGVLFGNMVNTIREGSAEFIRKQFLLACLKISVSGALIEQWKKKSDRDMSDTPFIQKIVADEAVWKEGITRELAA